MIRLPHYPWFVQKQGGQYLTNVYSGSLGANPTQASVTQTTFHYRVFAKVTKEDGPIALCAECFWRYPWQQGGGTSDVTEEVFAASPDSVAAAHAWLTEQYLANRPKDHTKQ